MNSKWISIDRKNIFSNIERQQNSNGNFFVYSQYR